MRKSKLRGEDREEGRSSQANLEHVESWTRRGIGLAEYAITDWLSRARNSAHSTDDVTRQNVGDVDQAECAGTLRVIRQSVVERGLVNHAQGNTSSLVSTSKRSADCIMRRTVSKVKKQN